MGTLHRVVHALSPARFGGLETVVRLLAAAQASAGHRVCVAVRGVDPADSTHPFIAALRGSAVDVRCFGYRKWNYRREREWLRDVCTGVDATILHTHGTHPDIFFSGVARQLGISAVSTVHGITGEGWKTAIAHRLQWRALRCVAAVVAVSRPLIASLELRGIQRDRIHLIRNAFAQRTSNTTREQAREALGVGERNAIGWVGRFSKEKGADVLLRAIAELGDTRAIAVLVGDGPDRSSLEELATTLGIAGSVRFAGEVPDASRVLPAFDAFVLSSRTEGTPMVLFEAMAAGVPIIATEVGGVPDVLTACEALLVPSEDHAAIARAIVKTIGDPAAAATRSARARQRLLDEFSPERWVREYEVLYARASQESSV